MFGSTKRVLAAALIAVLAVFAASGCKGPGAYEGENGEIDFGHDTGTPFTTPKLVKGAELTLKLNDSDDGSPLEVVTATSTDPAVVEVLEISGGRVVVRGVGAGSAGIDVEAESSGGTAMSDSLGVDVHAPAEHELSHECTAAPMAYYLPGGTYTLPTRVRGADGQRLVGERASYLEQDGEGFEIVGERTTTSELVIRSSQQSTPVTLRSTISGTELAMAVRPLEEADGLTTEPLVFLSTEGDDGVQAGDAIGLGVHPTVEGTTVCGYGLSTTVEPRTPEVCTLANEVGDEITERYQAENNVVLVIARNAGQCQFDVEMRVAETGEVLEKTVAIDVEPPSDE